MTGSADSKGRGIWATDVLGAVARVEGAVSQRVFVAVEGLDLPPRNAFGEVLAVERSRDVADLVRRCARAADEGTRVALVAYSDDLAAARGDLASLAARRVGLVVHAIAKPAHEGTPPSVVGLASSLALDSLLWGMLLGAGVSDAIDLALVARRAAEDSGCPFFVVHDDSRAHEVEPIGAPSSELCEAFVGRADARLRRAGASDPSGSNVADRAFAARVPFALGSAMRELEVLTGRHHDVIERAPSVDATVGLVGAGALGDSLIAEVERLRARGDDVVAVRVVSWRPFPAARLVRALGRALALTVLERVDQPLAASAPLALQIKAAFSDALTWAPDYPGIGRIPRIVSGVVAAGREVDGADLDAIVHNVLADERGKRSFVLGGDEAHALFAPPSPLPKPTAASAFVMRGLSARREVAVAAAELGAAVLSSMLGLRAKATVRDLASDEGGGVAFDLVASPARPRGTLAPHVVGVVAPEDSAFLERGDALGRLAHGGVLAMPSQRRSAEALWAEVPPWAKAVVFDRGARVVGWMPPTSRSGGLVDAPRDAALGEGLAHVWIMAASFVGIALAVIESDASLGFRGKVDGSGVEREVGEALRHRLRREEALAQDAPAIAERGAQAARTVFESVVEVPRATIDREDDGVRLGRRRPPSVA